MQSSVLCSLVLRGKVWLNQKLSNVGKHHVEGLVSDMTWGLVGPMEDELADGAIVLREAE